MVYVISTPPLYLARSEKVCFQPSFAVTVASSTFSPSASRFTLIDSGRTPSWSLLSSQTLVTATLVFSGVWVLVMVKPSAFVV